MKFTVVGSAEYKDIPTEATVSVDVTAEAASRKTAVDSVKKTLAQLSSLCETYTADGGPAKDWHVSGMSIHSWRPHDDHGRQLDPRFNATATGGITFVDTEKLGGFLEKVATTDHTAIGYVSWALNAEQLTTLHDKALTQALHHARHKATVLAEAAGVDAVELVSLREESAESHSYDQAAPRMAMATYGGSADEPTIELQPAAKSVSARVIADFSSQS